MIRIETAVAERKALRLSKPYSIAGRRIDTADNVIVTVTDKWGMTGLGAAAPSPEVTGETLEACVAASRRALEVCTRPIDLQQSGLRSWDDIFAGAPAACAAVEMAILDLDARQRGLPLVDLLGRHHRRLPTSVTIGIQPLDDAFRDAETHLANGFRILKVKLGDDLDSDIRLMRGMRALTGMDVDLRVDANQGYDLVGLKRFVDETADLRLELIEQPLPRGSYQKLLSLREESPSHAPFAADEDLISVDDAATLSAAGAYQVFNIKLMKCGGVTSALEIAAHARSAGIDLMWGCMDESCISISAAMHAAFASPNTKYIDLDGSFDLAADVATGGFLLSEGHLETRDDAGLGALLI